MSDPQSPIKSRSGVSAILIKCRIALNRCAQWISRNIVQQRFFSTVTELAKAAALFPIAIGALLWLTDSRVGRSLTALLPGRVRMAQCGQFRSPKFGDGTSACF